jgi:hypothetical protein
LRDRREVVFLFAQSISRMSACGTKRTFAAPQHFVRYWTRADIDQP